MLYSLKVDQGRLIQDIKHGVDEKTRNGRPFPLRI